MKIREFRAADGPAVAALIHQCLREVNSRDYPAAIIDRMCAYFTPTQLESLAALRQMFVAEDGEVLGTVSRDGNKVYTMFVLPRTIGRGVGRQLMEYIEALAAAEGHEFMETGASITAHGFYQRLGYLDIRTTETDFGFNYILRKPLRRYGPLQPASAKMAPVRSRGRRFVLGTGGYVTLVAALAAAPLVDDGRIGQVLYFVGWGLTLPTGLLIYPALWINLFIAGSLGLDDEQTLGIAQVGLVLIFAAAATVNALLARLVWPSNR